jgi:ABC-type lipoprotein release transport system permease subunit
VALLDVARGQVARQSHMPGAARAANRRLISQRKVALELVATFLVLMGIAIGILALRFALVLMHGVPH